LIFRKEKILRYRSWYLFGFQLNRLQKNFHEHHVPVKIVPQGLLAFRKNRKEVWFNTSTNKTRMLTVPYGETRMGQGKENARAFLIGNSDIRDEIEKKIRIHYGLIEAPEGPKPKNDQSSQ